MHSPESDGPEIVNPIDVRCFCAGHPMLARAGVTKDGEPQVHVKVWRGGRLQAEVIATAGIVKLRCRKCFRWHRVKIERGSATLIEERTQQKSS